ncbi:hypothetical protein Taro_022337, partial [Colocasia esculenta]|nr:hypothetical protein [Colocasia esculenta]
SSLTWVWVSEVVVALFRCRPASHSHCLALHWFQSRVGRLGVGPQPGRAAVVVVVLYCGSLVSLYRGGCRQESAAGELETEFLTLFPSESRCPSLHGGCSLAVSSAVGLVGLALWTVFSGFRSVCSLGVPGVGTQLRFL